jgi:glycosyltransferase involved in cell wall biosynthesis
MSKDKPISVVVSTRKIDDEYKKYILNSFNNKDTQLLIYENDNQYSLCELYNKGLDESTNDIVVFMHDDLIIDTPDLTPKINHLFKKNSEHGIIGLAGTDNLISGMWWEDKTSMYGIVNHEANGQKFTSTYNEQRFNEKVKEVIVIDGLFMMVHKGRIKNRFNEEFKGFHFYDLPFCLDNFKNGVKIGVTTKIRVTHKSVGVTNKQWEKNKLFFEAIYGNMFPVVI